MSRHLLLKSSDRTANSASSSNFRINLPQTVEGKYIVNHIVFPNSLANVIAGYNDKIYVDGGSSVTLDPGLYSTTTLATEVASKLQALDAEYGCTYSTSTYKFTITHTTGETLDFGTYSTASARRLLGFSATDIGAATSHTSDQQPDLAPQKSILVSINEAKKTILSTSLADTSANVYIAVAESFGDVINQTRSEIKQSVRFQRTNALNIKCYDVSGNILDLRGLDWEILLTAE